MHTIIQIQIKVIKSEVESGFFWHAYSDQTEMALNCVGDIHIRY